MAGRVGNRRTTKVVRTMTGLFSRGLFSRSGWGRVFAPLVRWLVKVGVTAFPSGCRSR